MSKIAEQLSPQQLAAIAAILSGGEATNNSASPKNTTATAVDPRPVVKGTGFTLCRLLGTKQFDDSNAVIDKDGSAVEFDDGSVVTFGDLKEVTNVRPDGSAGRHYPMVWSLHQSAASAAIDYLSKCPDRPKADGGQQRRSASPKAAASPQNDDRLARLEALVMQLAEGQFAQPAKPVVTPGHTKITVPAKPESTDWVVLTEGQIVEWDGELIQLTKTANGRLGSRKTIV